MKRVCMLTVHGIGFQRPPEGALPGYADSLHDRLRRELGTLLAGDPLYIQASWPPATRHAEVGLARLGRWSADGELDIGDRPLLRDGGPLTHVALVYSHLPDDRPQHMVGVEAAVMAARGVRSYESALGLARDLLADVRAIRHSQGVATDPSLTHAAGSDRPSGHPLTIIENDLAAYICRNDVRERVRGFVHEVLRRLLARSDIDLIVVNTHSQGSVIAFDVLRELRPNAAARVGALVTAGCPLRKYVEIFRWGNEVGGLSHAGRWLNFWDRRDPIADPLAPPESWRPGDSAIWPSGRVGLLQSVDDETGAVAAVPIEDVLVDNLVNAPGGRLGAHDYWLNQSEVIVPLAGVLRSLIGAPG